jgi:hypothetical protein
VGVAVWIARIRWPVIKAPELHPVKVNVFIPVPIVIDDVEETPA